MTLSRQTQAIYQVDSFGYPKKPKQSQAEAEKPSPSQAKQPQAEAEKPSPNIIIKDWLIERNKKMITKNQLHKIEMNLIYLLDENKLTKDDIINSFTTLINQAR
jgi:hypothetical protein